MNKTAKVFSFLLMSLNMTSVFASSGLNGNETGASNIQPENETSQYVFILSSEGRLLTRQDVEVALQRQKINPQTDFFSAIVSGDIQKIERD